MDYLLSLFSAPDMQPRQAVGKTIVVISDTHGAHRQLTDIPEADILIHAGDFTHHGSRADAEDFNAWLGSLPHKWKIVIEGNHENNAPWRDEAKQLLSNATFLRNETVDCDGLIVHGKEFFWNMRREDSNPYDDLIPDNVDVLAAHNPCRGYVDGGHGCESSAELVKKLRPRAYICGHIHSARGLCHGTKAFGVTLFVNGCSVVSERNGGIPVAGGDYVANGKPLVITV